MKARIYINGTEIDLFDEFQLSFTYSIADIREPENKSASFSKTITIPASKTNNLLFTQIYEVNKEIITAGDNFTPDYNPNVKAECFVTVDGLQVMRGYCQVLKANRKDDYIVSYEIVVVNENKDLIEQFKDDKLNSLDFSEYEHAYNQTIIQASWDTYIVKNGSQYNNFSGGLPIGEGYIYASNLRYYKNPLTVGSGITQNDLPAVYLKTYVDKIFQAAGKRYISNFFDSQYFKNLIVPASRYTQVLDQDEIDDIAFEVNDADLGTTNFVGQDSLYTTKVGLRSYTLNPEQYDFTYNYYDPQTAWAGDLKYDADYNAFMFLDEPSNTGTSNTGTIIITHELIQDLNGVITVLDNYVDTINLQASDGASGTINLAVEAGKVAGKFTPSLTYTDTFDDATNTQAKYYVRIKIQINTQFKDGSSNEIGARVEFNFRDYNQRFYNVIDNSNLAPQSTVYLNRFIDSKITIKDFMASIVKCFNLYIEPDPKDPANFYIEPYEDFYSAGTTKDWTGKIDVEDIQVIPLNSLGIRSFNFGFTNDTDVHNKEYTEKYPEVYGDYRLYVKNDFNTEDKVIKPIFSPTPLSDRYHLTNFENIFFDEKEQPRTINLRVLTYGGVRDDGGGNYCFIGEVDNPKLPDVAIRYDLAPSELYYFTDTLTNNTLFNKFWAKYIREFTDINSKMVIVKARLTPLDVANFRFNDKVWILDSYYKVNKIMDYNPLNDGLCTIELIKTGAVGNFKAARFASVVKPKSFNVVEGGLDEIRDVAAISEYNLVEGGLDEVRDLGATSPDNLINGGQNVV